MIKILSPILSFCLVLVIGPLGCSSSGDNPTPDGSTDADDGMSGDEDVSEHCPPAITARYTCDCLDPGDPDWLRQGENTAWQEPSGEIGAVGVITRVSDLVAARDQSLARAFSLLTAHRVGVKPSDGTCFLEAYVEANLTCAEAIDSWSTRTGTLVYARLRAAGETTNCPVATAVLEATCPRSDPPEYRCNCEANQTPAWMRKTVWNGDDGFAYGVGLANDQESPELAENRAKKALIGYLNGVDVSAGPQDKVCLDEVTTHGDATGVGVVATETLDGDTYTLVRRWIGR